jgi:small subunit ribosomal protein S13
MGSSLSMGMCAKKQAERGALCVRAARVAGVEIPNNKRAETALTYIYGVGDTTAKKVMATTGLENKRMREFEEDELTRLREAVDELPLIEGDLRRFNSMNIKRLKEIQCHRGKRHIQGLPCRGQRTKTNARTRKGKVKTVAGKKK